MKNLFKTLVVVTLLSFVSCTENQEIVTNNGQIIDSEQHAVKKDDITENQGGDKEPDLDED
ncbi:hypothetical protein [Tenacibaculum jejuense]|uniref:Lipoprotein n=1 Tax=Tenacibaculum jejuense TaxID=584609 RepID=A0A238U5Y0_9FLAO|nr:hypothetical protein [Tenacibaculum jejuense]SNR14547.1 protein of unknown function [Tenacibaculum jejuense]